MSFYSFYCIVYFVSQKFLNELETVCDSFLLNKRIRFISVIDKMGNSIIEKNQPNVKILISDKQSRSLFIKSVLETLLQKDFDEHMGLLKYNISRRSKVDMIIIPIHDYVVLISLFTEHNCDLIATNAIKLFSKVFDHYDASE